MKTEHFKAAFNFNIRLKTPLTDMLVSFNVLSLFMQVPLADTVELLTALFTTDMIELFESVLASSYW